MLNVGTKINIAGATYTITERLGKGFYRIENEITNITIKLHG
jgi:hypothetical protein